MRGWYSIWFKEWRQVRQHGHALRSSVNTMHNRLGIDIVQGANVIAEAIHLWQEGIIDEKYASALVLE